MLWTANGANQKMAGRSKLAGVSVQERPDVREGDNFVRYRTVRL
jgi:hypothetical protein